MSHRPMFSITRMSPSGLNFKGAPPHGETAALTPSGQDPQRSAIQMNNGSPDIGILATQVSCAGMIGAPFSGRRLMLDRALYGPKGEADVKTCTRLPSRQSGQRGPQRA